jgi:lipopolysaccharide export system permease protein
MRFFGMLIGLISVLQLLDLMAVSDAIMAADGATSEEIARYISLRLPQLISKFTPFSALLATLLTLASLNQHSEIIIMKAAGLSAHRILLPLGIPCLLIFLANFTFNETVVWDGNAELQYWQDNDFAVDLPPPPEYAKHIRMLDGNTLILAEAVRKTGDAVFVDKVSLYNRDDEGNMETLTRANFALYKDNNWVLFDVRTFDSYSHQLTVAESQPWLITLSPERFLTATVNPDHVGIFELNNIINKMEDEGRGTDSLFTTFLQKLAGPASTLLMPLLGAIAGFGVHRAGSMMVRIIIGMALGFTFFVADNFMLAMGEFGVAPPFLAAFGPFVLFLTVGLAVLFYTEE